MGRKPLPLYSLYFKWEFACLSLATLFELTGLCAGLNTAESRLSLIQLRRESVPVYRQGKIASFKTSYSGVLRIGSPAQDFNVVFDTGSGNIILPSAACESEACLYHQRFNMSKSTTAVAVQTSGKPAAEGEPREEIIISFGTGRIAGNFVRDTVCLAPGGSMHQNNGANVPSGTCLDMNVITALQMSDEPFRTFEFDGILGLGLSALAVSTDFSIFHLLSGKLGKPLMGAFLTEGEHGEESEMSFGGYNPARLLEPLSWAPVAMPGMGYWQVEILAVRVNGQELDVCTDGTCRGVVDTGTSHLGIPAPYDVEINDLLTTSAGDLLDCRLANAPVVQIELRGYNLTLGASNYMRRLPLREGVSVGSPHGVTVDNQSAEIAPQTEVQTPAEPVASQEVGVAEESANETEVRRFCRPRTMAVRLPKPVGPKLFILGEPVLHRYYTVYDWKKTSVGFALANNRRNTVGLATGADGRGVLPKEVDSLLLQTKMVKSTRGRGQNPLEDSDDDDVDDVILLQIRVFLDRVPRKVSFCSTSQM